MPFPTTIRVGIAGFGRLARQYYVSVLKSMPRVTIVAVADPLDHSRRAATQLLGKVRTYDAVAEMCEKEDLQALLVASPPSSHLDAWRTAQARGLQTFLEKPLCMTSQFHTLPQFSDEQAGVMLNFNRRFWPAYQTMAEAVADGRLGQLRSIELVLQTNVEKWSTVTQHRLSLSDGGVLHDLGSQAIDVVCQIAGCEPTSISAARTLTPSRFEQIHLQMEFAKGRSALCRIGYGSSNRECLIVVGTERSMVLREPNMAPHLLSRGARLRPQHYFEDYVALGYRFLAPRERMLHYTMSKALTQFSGAVRTRQPQRPGYSEGVANMRLLTRAAESMQACSAQVMHG